MSECPRHIHPVYRPSDAGPIVVYAGDLLLSEDGVERDGQVAVADPAELELLAEGVGAKPPHWRSC